MRPLIRRAWDPALASIPAALAVQDAFGRYCATCERDLPAGAVAWNGATQTVVNGPADAASWPDLLVLCQVCAAHVARGAPATPAMALPHREQTFALGGSSAFRYELRRLTVRHADGDEDVERVVVSGASVQAAETIRRFALNTTPHDGDELDWRLVDRTRAWHAAEEAAGYLAAATTSRERMLLCRSIATLAAAHGCWSVWATVLWMRLRDASLIAAILLPPREPGGAPATVARHAFAGTSDAWLPPAATGSGAARDG